MTTVTEAIKPADRRAAEAGTKRPYQHHKDLTRICPYAKITCIRPYSYRCPKRRFLTREVVNVRTQAKIEDKISEFCAWWGVELGPKGNTHD